MSPFDASTSHRVTRLPRVLLATPYSRSLVCAFPNMSTLRGKSGFRSVTDHTKKFLRDTSSHELELSFRVSPYSQPQQVAGVYPARCCSFRGFVPFDVFPVCASDLPRKFPHFQLRCVRRLSQPSNAFFPRRPIRLISSRIRPWDSPFEDFLLRMAPYTLSSAASFVTLCTLATRISFPTEVANVT